MPLEESRLPLVAVGPVGFVGCGRMGGPMARRLLAAGATLRAYDVDERALAAVADAGADVADSPRAACDGAAIAVTMLPDPPTVNRAARGPDGLLAGLGDGALWLEMSSSRPSTTRTLAGAAAERGAALLDAPVSGGVAGAEAGTLTIMLGGPPALVERARPLLSVLGRSLVHVGDRPGDGDAAKTINNMLSATNLAAAAEALAMGIRAGLDPERLVDCVNGGTGASHAMEQKIGGQVLTGRFASRFTLGQYLKDLGIARGLADDHRVPTPVNGAAHALWTAHAARGHADADHTRLVALLLADAGIEHDFAAQSDGAKAGGAVESNEEEAAA
jgi:3-hydroxyisobutyrate dehydrogenase-like beta-hydroxyacid dehydrogenase